MSFADRFNISVQLEDAGLILYDCFLVILFFKSNFFKQKVSKMKRGPEGELAFRQHRMCADKSVFSWSLRITIVKLVLATQMLSFSA